MLEIILINAYKCSIIIPLFRDGYSERMKRSDGFFCQGWGVFGCGYGGTSGRDYSRPNDYGTPCTPGPECSVLDLGMYGR